MAILGVHRSHEGDGFEEGFRDTFRADGCDARVESEYIAESTKFEEKDVLAVLKQMFAKPEPPTAISATYDLLAGVIYLLLPKLGFHVPKDVSLLGFGGNWREGAVTQRLNSVVVDEVAAGRQVVTLLHEMRCGDRPIDDNTEIALDLNLSNGETLGSP